MTKQHIIKDERIETNPQEWFDSKSFLLIQKKNKLKKKIKTKIFL